MMKKIIFSVVLTCFILSIAAAQDGTTKIKTIQVVGKAEQEVTPDEIFVQINLREYKKGGKKVSMNRLESELVNAVKKLGLPKENLTVTNIYGYNWNWRKKKAEDFLATKSFKLKVNEVSKMNELVDLLDEEGINSMNINQYQHSRIEEMQAELKVKAIRAAREKARKLLAAIDEELGGAVEVSETDVATTYPNNRRYYAEDLAVSNVAFDAKAESYQSDLGFKKIKLTANIRVVFAIK